MKQKTKFKQTEIGKIPEDWEVRKLNEIGKIITGKTPSSNNPEQFGKGIPFVTPSDFGNYNKNIYSANREISEKGQRQLNNLILDNNSVLVTCIGSDMGKVAIAKTKCITNQQINSITEIKDFNPDFLYYKLKSLYLLLRSLATSGSTMPIINKTQFGNIEVTIPKFLQKQTSIASILSSLDAKIELNNKMNQILESIGQVLFKKWFVDERKGGWKIKKIKEIVAEKKHAIVDGPFGTQLHNDEYVSEGIPVIRIINLSFEGHFINENLVFVTEDKFNFLKRSAVYPGDILLAKTGATIGKFSITPNYIKQAIIASSILKISPKESNRYYLYYIIKDLSDKKYWESVSSGSTRSTINLIDVRDIEIVIPDSEILNKFESLMKNFFSIIETNNLQSQKLSKIRDILLPKLMSGEIRVKDL